MAHYIFPFACLALSVTLPTGVLTGVPGADPEVTIFKGIPYAAVPFGDLRWTPPAPPVPGASKECLCLTVWTAAKSTSEHRPVVVFLSEESGEPLAKQGVVAVTVTSRTGLMGYLAHPDLTAESAHKSSGNYALLDQLAALDFVHRNIAAFGGDPKRVTIAGPTAALLAGSPLAKDLFSKAFATASPPTTPLADAENAGDTFAQAENAHSIRFLRPMEIADLLQGAIDEHYSPGPVIDGWVLTADWQKPQPGIQLKSGAFDLKALLAFTNQQQ